jgi:hypothetical protein
MEFIINKMVLNMMVNGYKDKGKINFLKTILKKKYILFTKILYFTSY